MEKKELKLIKKNKLDCRNCTENILICCKYTIVCEMYGYNVLFFVELCKYILSMFSLHAMTRVPQADFTWKVK